MRVALVQLTNKHTEIFGIFIEYFLYRKIDFKIYYNLEKDKYSFLPYYEKLFNCKLDIIPTKYFLEEEFDWYIFTSSQEDNRFPDTIKYNLNNKSLFVQHLKGHQKRYMINSIKVSPVINLKIPYVLPIFLRYYNVHGNYEQNRLAFVGAVRGNMVDKDLTLISDILERYDNFEIYVFMRKWDWVVARRRFNFLNDERIKCFSGLETEAMVNRLKEVKMIAPLSKRNGWFHRERLTGALPLGLNLNIPLIMDERFAKIYGIGDCGLVYQDRMTEVFDDFLGMGKEKYFKYVKNIAIFRKKQFKKNKENLDSFFDTKV